MAEIMTRTLLDGRFFDTDVQDGKLVYIFDKKKHAQAILKNLILMQDNDEGSLTDVVIISKEKEEFHFHGPILAALSKEFEENLLKQGLGSVTSRVVIKEKFTSEALQCLWDYAYTSVVTLTLANIGEVKELAEHYGIDKLMNECKALEEEFDENPGEIDEVVELEFQNLPKIILNRLYEFLELGKLSSTVITGSEPLAKALCHGAIIVAACGGLSSQLVGGDSKNKIQLTDTIFKVIVPFLRYLYSAKLAIDPSTVQPLLEMAITFNVPSVGYACCCWLEDALTAENALGIISVARECKEKINIAGLETSSNEGIILSDTCNELYQYARSFILKNFLTVKDSDEFLELDVGEVANFINEDDLAIDSEEDVFYAIMKWVEFDPETRGEELPNLLQSIRLEYTDLEFLYSLMENKLLKTNPSCIAVIEKALRDKDVLEQNHVYQAEREIFQEKIGREEDFDRPEIYPNEFSTPAPESLFLTPNQNEFFEKSLDDQSLHEAADLGRKPDMRLRRNRNVLLPKGRNVDGSLDMRLKENKMKKPDIAKKLVYLDEDLARRKDGKPDRRFKVVKENEKKERDTKVLASVHDDKQRRKDGKPDMRFKVNKMKTNKQIAQDASLKMFAEGPTRKDGQPDMRFKVNRYPEQDVLCTGSARQDKPKKKDDTHSNAANKKIGTTNLSSRPLKKDGTPDMRFTANKNSSEIPPRSASSGPVKKDGTPDMRFASNKTTPNNSNPSFVSSNTLISSGPLKKDGTPDMRYSRNKGSFGSSSSSCSESISSFSSGGYSGSSGSSAPSGPLKKDGTPDMRYRTNKASYGSSSSSYSSSFSSYGGSTSSLSSGGYSGSSGSSAARGPLKSDGTPDMRYSSNKSAFGSSSSSYGNSSSYGSSSSYRGSTSSSSYLGSYHSSAPSGPLKSDGTPDMRYSSNRR